MENNCALIEELLSLYIDDEIGEEAREQIDKHLKSCPSCQALLEKMKTVGTLPELAPLKAQPADTRVQQIVGRYKTWLVKVLIGVALGCLLGGFVVGLFYTHYDEFIASNTARQFVKFGLTNDLWLYQEKFSQELQASVSKEEYLDWRYWREAEADSASVKASGITTHRTLWGQQYGDNGPTKVRLKVFMELTRSGWKVQKVQVLKEVEQQEATVKIPDTDPTKGERFIEGKILELNYEQKEITFQQHIGDANTAEYNKPLRLAEGAQVVLNVRGNYYRLNLINVKPGCVFGAVVTKEGVIRALIVSQ